MTLDQAAAFLVFALVAAITPGPSNTMIVATASAAGLWRGLPCVLGASAGMGTLLFCSALGLGQLVIAQPMLLRALNWGGAAFLLWLAWKIANAGRVSDVRAPKPVGFIGAAAFQWINPKGWLVAVAPPAPTCRRPPTMRSLKRWPSARCFSPRPFRVGLSGSLSALPCTRCCVMSAARECSTS